MATADKRLGKGGTDLRVKRGRRALMDGTHAIDEMMRLISMNLSCS